MASSTVFKVYRGKEFIASFKYLGDAIVLVAHHGKGSSIRHGHSLALWLEGYEEYPASESYDLVADICRSRYNAHLQKIRDLQLTRV